MLGTATICPLGCAGDAPRRIARYRSDRRIEPGAVLRTPEPGWVDVRACDGCGLEWLDADIEWTTAPGDAHLGLALQYEADPEGERRRAQAFLAVARRRRPPPGRLFDIGCGVGTLLKAARDAGWQASGNDIVAGAVERLRAEGFDAHAGPLAGLALPEASFDVVTAFCVLPHVPDPLAEATLVRRLLAPGGVFVAEMPAAGLYRGLAKLLAKARIDWGVRNVYYPGHRYAFSPRPVRALLERAGFDEIEVAPFRMPRSVSARRFALRGGAMGTMGAWGVAVGDLASRTVRSPNHMIVAARNPLRRNGG